MTTLHFRSSTIRRNLSKNAAAVALFGVSIVTASADADESATTTPIKHVIVIIGENRSFDHIFATYEPVRQRRDNLVSGASDMSGLGSTWFVRFLNREITCCRRFGWREYGMRSSRIVRDD